MKFMLKRNASAGNRTRVTRVAGENSTTEPPMLHCRYNTLPYITFFPLHYHFRRIKHISLPVYLYRS